MTARKNALEWSVFAASLALILVVVIVLVHAHVTSEDRPPSIAVSIGDAIQAPEGYAVPLLVRNEGDRTAEDVHLEVVLATAAGEERATAVISFVPHRSERRAWVTFSRDPAAGRLTLRVLGYEEP